MVLIICVCKSRENYEELGYFLIPISTGEMILCFMFVLSIKFLLNDYHSKLTLDLYLDIIKALGMFQFLIISLCCLQIEVNDVSKEMDLDIIKQNSQVCFSAFYDFDLSILFVL